MAYQAPSQGATQCCTCFRERRVAIRGRRSSSLANSPLLETCQRLGLIERKLYTPDLNEAREIHRSVLNELAAAICVGGSLGCHCETGEECIEGQATTENKTKASAEDISQSLKEIIAESRPFLKRSLLSTKSRFDGVVHHRKKPDVVSELRSHVEELVATQRQCLSKIKERKRELERDMGLTPEAAAACIDGVDAGRLRLLSVPSKSLCGEIIGNETANSEQFSLSSLWMKIQSSMGISRLREHMAILLAAKVSPFAAVPKRPSVRRHTKQKSSLRREFHTYVVDAEPDDGDFYMPGPPRLDC